jgi:hypothetical protein
VLLNQLHGFVSVGGLAQHLKIFLRAQQRRQRLAQHGVVVGDHDPQLLLEQTLHSQPMLTER